MTGNIKLKPDAQLKQSYDSSTVCQLAETGKQYAFNFENIDQGRVSLDLPAGNYTIDVISVEDGTTISLGRKEHEGRELQLDISTRKNFALRALTSTK